ncbi:class C sortase [Glutamicibacter sp. MNS18]|uniref:class C sortase n=1 Tax=Glutamicibacter sp. MNS18 TaxID=2989817 RepID=UPI002235DDD1|nr:class C sortase [Glutamicibacter sp. MNS18]MCW4466133.1 class C sortase [Glutamicibacter sp. MNS18]
MTSATRVATRRRPAYKARRRRVAPLSLVITVMVVLGVFVMLYPAAASWYSAVLQTQQSERYVQVTEGIDPALQREQLQLARDYNRSLASGSRVVDPFSALAEQTVKTDDPYWQLLDPAGDGKMARIRIPKLDLKLPIYHGTAGDVLVRGAGHLQGTALPVGGSGTHSVLTAHRGLPQAAMFTELDQLDMGDHLEVDVLSTTLVYRVTGTRVVLPTETETLRAQEGLDQLSLVTCTPLGINSHRIIVTAERVTPTPADAGQDVDSVGFPWWAVGVLATVCGAVIYLARDSKTQR